MSVVCVLLWACLAFTQTAVAADATPVATVDQPRSFGHVLGDVLTQRVLLLREGREVLPSSMPAADRVNVFLERRASRIEQDELGVRWLVIEYQVVNGPRALTVANLPAVALATDAGPLQVPSWPISIGPLTPTATFDQGALQALRPDRPVEPQATQGLERDFERTLAALAAVLLAWAAWWAWRNHRESHRLPFAQAWQEIRRVEPTSAQAWLALHRALNDTAGRVVHGRSLPRLLSEAPHLQPLSSDLDAFFRHSEQRFFATAAGTAPGDLSLRQLALALRDAERQHHG